MLVMTHVDVRSPVQYAKLPACGTDIAAWRWLGSIRARAGSGCGSGCFPPPGSIGMGPRPAPPPSPARVGLPAGREACGPSGGESEAREPPYPPSLVRDASHRGRPRYPNRPGAAGAPRREHDHDLYARSQPRPSGGPQPGRPDVPAVIRPRRVCGRVCQDMLHGRAAYPGRGRGLTSERSGGKQRTKAQNSREHDAWIGGGRGQGLLCYADPPILSSNSSSTHKAKRAPGCAWQGPLGT